MSASGTLNLVRCIVAPQYIECLGAFPEFVPVLIYVQKFVGAKKTTATFSGCLKVLPKYCIAQLARQTKGRDKTNFQKAYSAESQQRAKRN